MSDDEDGNASMRFTTDTDYEGGRWIGGEFYYGMAASHLHCSAQFAHYLCRAEKAKQKDRQSKEDSIYGVFGESSDRERRPRKRGRFEEDTYVWKNTRKQEEREREGE